MRFLCRMLLYLVFYHMVSCNSLFYAPRKEIVSNPKRQLGLEFVDYQVKSTDGTKLNVWLMRPKDGEPLARILHFHGNAENMSTHFMFVAWLTEFGFEVMTFDYRGYGRSDGSADRQGVLEDGISLIKHASADVKHLFVIGQSLGGAVAIPAIAKARPANLRALVIDSSFYSYREMARLVLDRVWLTWPLQYPLSYLVTDNESPRDYLSEITQPTLVIHGDKDTIVPLSQGQAIFAGLKQKDKDFWLIEGGAHTSSFYPGPYRDKIYDFLCAHLPKCEVELGD